MKKGRHRFVPPSPFAAVTCLYLFYVFANDLSGTYSGGPRIIS
jgi:hypothetical protein